MRSRMLLTLIAVFVRADILWQDLQGSVVMWMIDGSNVMDFGRVGG